MDAEEGSIKVIVRVRPELPHDSVDNGLCNVKSKTCVQASDQCIRIEKSARHVKEFTFKNILGTASSQYDTYLQSCKGIVERFIHDGDDGCVLCYDQSGSGKTFTMFGADSSSSRDFSAFGLLQNSLHDVCSYVNSCWEGNTDGGAYIFVSCYEISSDGLVDSLAPEGVETTHAPDTLTDSDRLLSREVTWGEASVEGLTRLPVHDFEDGCRLLRHMKQTQQTSRGAVQIHLERVGTNSGSNR